MSDCLITNRKYTGSRTRQYELLVKDIPIIWRNSSNHKELLQEKSSKERYMEPRQTTFANLIIPWNKFIQNPTICCKIFSLKSTPAETKQIDWNTSTQSHTPPYYQNPLKRRKRRSNSNLEPAFTDRWVNSGN